MNLIVKMYPLTGADSYIKWQMPLSAKVLSVAWDHSREEPVLFAQEDPGLAALTVRTFYTQATGDDLIGDAFDFSNMEYVGTVMQPPGVDDDREPGLHIYEIVGRELDGDVSG